MGEGDRKEKWASLEVEEGVGQGNVKKKWASWEGVNQGNGKENWAGLWVKATEKRSGLTGGGGDSGSRLCAGWGRFVGGRGRG